MKNIGKPFPPVWFAIASLIFALIYTTVKKRAISSPDFKSARMEYRNKPRVGNVSKSPAQVEYAR